VNGVLDIIRAFREGVTGTRPTFWMEVGSDIQGRTADIWCCPPYSYGGGERKREVVRYTIPYRVCVYQLKGGYDPASATEEVNADINDALVNGFALSVRPDLVDTCEPFGPALGRFLRIRRELREADAPGFPYGFRDQVGLSVDSPGLEVRSYADPSGITVVYAALEAVKTTFRVDPNLLGIAGDPVSFSVDIGKHEAGYRIIEP